MLYKIPFQIKLFIWDSKLQKIEGIIFDISRMALNDGPGIRTTVFLKGCNMNCKWCHNPESISQDLELLYSDHKCIKCRKCEKVCTGEVHGFIDAEHSVDRNKCNACGKCIDVCPTRAVEISGEKVTVKEVLDIITRDKIFYDVSNGGLTISGGEPLAQKEFTFGLLREAKALGINTILDTNGYWNWKDMEKMLPCIYSFRYDLKIMDCNMHKFYTGVSNKVILGNLEKLSKIEKDVVIVIPLIEKINDTDENIKLFISFIRTLHKVPKVQILPYHSLYISKSRKLGGSDRLFSTSEDEDIKRVKGILMSEGIDLHM